MRGGFLIMKKDVERIWKQHCVLILAYIAVLFFSSYLAEPAEAIIKFHYWLLLFTLVVSGSWSIHFIVDERRKKTILLLLSLPISLREIVFAKFSLELLISLSTYLTLYLVGGILTYGILKTNVFLGLSTFLHILSGIVFLMTILAAFTFLFNPALSYILIMFLGVAVVTAATIIYQTGFLHLDPGSIRILIHILVHPVTAGLAFLGTLLFAAAVAQATWRILNRQDPVELAV
ncbi:MAG: hypothetical protein Kow00109_11590 [Acidobacteriota bacterium]